MQVIQDDIPIEIRARVEMLTKILHIKSKISLVACLLLWYRLFGFFFLLRNICWPTLTKKAKRQKGKKADRANIQRTKTQN